MSGVDPAQFRQLLGRFATGVTVVTTRDPAGRPVGMTASSVASVSLAPPLVLVSVDQKNDLHPALRAAQRFVLNVLASDQEAVSRRFGMRDALKDSRTVAGCGMRVGLCSTSARAPATSPALRSRPRIGMASRSRPWAST